MRINSNLKFCRLLFLGLLIIGLSNCSSNQKNELSEEEKAAKEAHKADSANLAKILGENPFLEPPDTNYTGDFFMRYQNGITRVRGFFRFGKKHGKWMYFFENGTLWSEAFYEKGLNEGEATVYHPNGKVYYKGSYKNGKPSGLWEFFDSTGVKATERKY